MKKFMFTAIILFASYPVNSQGLCTTYGNVTTCNSPNNRTETIIKGPGNTSTIYQSPQRKEYSYPSTIGDTRSNDEYYNGSNKQNKRDPFTR